MDRSTILTFPATLGFPRHAALFARLGLQEIAVDSLRRAIAAIKRTPPDFILAEFVYAWGNNYASCHISNLDSLLASLPKYAPRARVIILAQPGEMEYAQRLGEVYPLHGIAPLSVAEHDLELLLLNE
ncbi:MAG: hypothetical protein M0R77_16760 [Gammaproteobacteria bacterium]|nr:hypothetical protein [Gammaproteobacteria bacterium]